MYNYIYLKLVLYSNKDYCHLAGTNGRESIIYPRPECSLALYVWYYIGAMTMTMSW